MFQFYLSSIKSNIHNSEQGELFLFQFYLSSIKSFFDELECTGENSFNSTLVQLKGKTGSGRKKTRTVFQFYLSSIKRRIRTIKPSFWEEFQFYLSSIKSR